MIDMLAVNASLLLSWLTGSTLKTSTRLDTIRGVRLQISQDSCLARTGILTSNISLATTAHRLHHLDMARPQTISTLTSPTILFPIFLTMGISVHCNINSMKDHGPTIPQSSIPTTGTIHRALSKPYLPTMAGCNNCMKRCMSDQIVKCALEVFVSTAWNDLPF